MTKVPVPQQDNTLQSLALAISKAVASSVPVAGSLIGEYIDKTNQKLTDNGHKIFLEEVSKGNVDLSDHEKEAFIPIAYRYLRAASEGTVNRNLRLLAKVIRKQIDESDLSYENYSVFDNAVKDLSLPEMVILSELCNQINHVGIREEDKLCIYKVVSIDNYSKNDYYSLVKTIESSYIHLFESSQKVSRCFSTLSGKGWLTSFVLLAYGSSPVIYRPSDLTIYVRNAVSEMSTDLSNDTNSTRNC